jgi:type II secretory pathway pseudopilin PulG
VNTTLKTSHELGGFSPSVLLRLIIIIAFLAVIGVMAVPHLPLHTEQTHLVMLENRLADLRNAADLYYHQHQYRYPGEYDAVNGTTRFHQGQESTAATAFIAQLTRYSNAAGATSPVKTRTFTLGPYLPDTTLPDNPFVSDGAANDIEMDLTLGQTNVIYPPDGRTGWRYYLKTGRLVANDDTPLDDGSRTAYR